MGDCGDGGAEVEGWMMIEGPCECEEASEGISAGFWFLDNGGFWMEKLVFLWMGIVSIWSNKDVCALEIARFS